MAIAAARHVESVARSGAASAVVTHLGVVELHRIRRREWSRIMAVNIACQGVMRSHRVHRKKWSRVMAVIVARQWVQNCRSELGWGR